MIWLSVFAGVVELEFDPNWSAVSLIEFVFAVRHSLSDQSGQTDDDIFVPFLALEVGAETSCFVSSVAFGEQLPR